MAQARVGRRLVAFQQHRAAQLAGGGLDGGDQLQVVIETVQGRHKQVQATVARLGAQRGAHHAAGRLEEARHRRSLALARLAVAIARVQRGAQLLLDALPAGQRRERLVRVLRRDIGVVQLADPGLRVQRQAVAQRRIAGDQPAVLVAQEPGAGQPGIIAGAAHQRQDLADHLAETAAEHLAQALTLQRVTQTRILRGDVGRQAALAPQVIEPVLIGREYMLGGQPQAPGQAGQEACGQACIGAVVAGFVGIQRRVLPDRLAVLAPEAVERPARQLLTRVPLALAEMHQGVRRIVRAQAVEQLGGQAALVRPHGGGVPLGIVRVVERDEGRLATHGQAHIAIGQLGIDLAADAEDVVPLLVAVGLGDPRRLPDALHAHVVRELALAFVEHPGDRRRRGRLRAAGQRHMPFTGEQAGSRVEADPASAGQVHLAPGVQVGEVLLGAAGAVEGFDVGRELDQVAGDETRRQPQVAQQLHQQPGRIAARAGSQLQGFFRRLHARLHADQVADVLRHALVERHQEVDAGRGLALDTGQVLGEQRPAGLGDQIGRQLAPLGLDIGEGNLLGMRLEEEVEGVEHRHLGDQVDGDLELFGLLREHQARQVVALRVLLPVDEVLARPDLQRIGEDARAAVRRRAQAYHLRAEVDRAVVAVVRDVLQCDMDRHGVPPASQGDTCKGQDLCHRH